MSIASIILGLLIWFSLPPFYRHGISPKAFFYLSLACKVIGICFIAGGILAAFF